MSVLQHSLPITTDAEGAMTRDVRLGACQLLAVSFEVGTLETVNVTITDEPAGVSLLALTGLTADGTYQLGRELVDTDGSGLGGYASPVVTGRAHVVVASGGDTKTGRLVLTYAR